MQIPGWFRGAAATACALGLVAGPVATAYAAPTPTPSPSTTRTPAPTPSAQSSSAQSPTASTTASATPSRTPAKVKATPAAQCVNESKLTLLGFNDFHGRLAQSNPDTVGFFGDIEKLRTEAGGDANTILYGAGDSVGGSLFTSASQDDNPTIDILNAAGVDGSAVGNHEFDKGAKDFTDRIVPRAKFPYTAANITSTSTGQPIAQPYTIFDKAGLKVAVVGAVTGDLGSLVSPAGMEGWKVTDPVDAVNAQVAQLKDGNPANGEADLVIASFHEGSPGSTTEPTTAPPSAPAFDRIINGTDSRVSAILNGHTHQTYAYQAPVPGMTGVTRPVIQTGSYATNIGKIELGFDPATKQVGCYSVANIKSTMTSAQATATYERARQVKTILDEALAQAKVVGSQVVGEATAPIAREAGASRNRESVMSDTVAQMFYDQLSAGNPNFIGMQNPGGTRADINAGEITYEEAASILPFANSLMTTEITGAQLKTVLEQQWQRDAAGNVPSRPYLQLGLSRNVSYTYDASRAEGDRITSIAINGTAVDPAAKYTVGSGSFLIAGGDNFFELGKGTNTRDSGRVDLEAFVDWVKKNTPLSPNYARQSVSMTPKADVLEEGKATTFRLGVPSTVAPDTIDMTVNGTTAPPQPNTRVVATINDQQVGEAAISNGQGELTVTLPAGMPAGPAILKLVASPTNTTAYVPVTLQPAYGPLGKPIGNKFCGLRDGGCGQHFENGSVYSSPNTGEHVVKGAIRDKWAATGWETGKLGYPTSDEFCGLRDGGCAQRFEGGLIYWTPATGAYPVWGAISVAYADVRWETSKLGYPTSDEFCGLRDGGCAQRFTGGLIYWSPASGPAPVWGAIGQKYADLGWETGQLGYPLGGEFCGLRDGGCAQRFQGGSIYWSPASGAHQSWGLIRDYWAQNGWETGRFGYPVWDEQCAPNGDAWECRQSYQGGVITYNSRTGMRG
ncbi:5'-nucleotidase C-terminal domain-containing protein [Enemella evansiae]|uniref:5'-nucleotidase C-terminal domain-containing protein n=1 Tax=Enemella evansiae TaxID=2016499 RepID=UPI000B96F2EF|nr:5'-nucleotidase C-terminal domain-containing protein [Enemella evansiae]OYO02671.1 hypothetical protein CGZ97_14835 [Enemella evansiae]